MNDQHRLRGTTRGFIGPWVSAALVVTVGSLLLWSVVSMSWLTLACWSYWWLCWIPAVATNGVAAISSHFSMLERVEPSTRRYAAGVAVTGVSLDVIATASQHYLALEHLGISPTDIHPAPYWGWVVGGLPSLMAGLLIHVIYRIRAQTRRDQATAECERIEAARKARERAEEDRRIADERTFKLAIVTAEANTEELRISRLQKESDADQKRTEADKATAAKLRAQEKLRRSEGQDQEQAEEVRDSGPRRGPQPVRSSPKSSGLDVSELITPARTVADRLAAEGKELSRSALVSGLRTAGYSCSTDRANELLRVLRSGKSDSAQTGLDRRGLRAVVR